MKKIITFSEEQLFQMKNLLNMITTTGVQNAKYIAIIDQTLDSGMPGEIKEQKPKEGD